MRHFIQFIGILFFLGLYSCLEPFDPTIPNAQKKFLVVDGIITDQPGPYTISITRSSSLDEGSTPISGIKMSIEEENGITETLNEIQPGIYQTISLKGIAGKRYRLNFNYEDEKYQSNWEKINYSPIIDNVYFEVETKGTTNKENDLTGLQFFLDSHSTEASNYFRFEWDETWKVGVSWPITDDYIGRDRAQPTKKKLNTVCWKHHQADDINLATTVDLSQSILSKHKLGFVTGENQRFTRGYSILVKQYSLSKEEYLFWVNLKESNEELGTLFAKQPANVIGNITNISKPTNTVLGYFSASGFQEKRVFVNTNSLPFILSINPPCPLETLLKEELMGMYENTLLEKIRNGKLFFEFIFPGIGLNPIGATLSTEECSDCVANGGSTEKPDFWEE